jgi:hypothetical protein
MPRQTRVPVPTFGCFPFRACPGGGSDACPTRGTKAVTVVAMAWRGVGGPLPWGLVSEAR